MARRCKWDDQAESPQHGEKATARYEARQRGIAKDRKKKIVVVGKTKKGVGKEAKRTVKVRNETSIIREDQQPRPQSHAPQPQPRLDADTTFRAAKRRRRANAAVNLMSRVFAGTCNLAMQPPKRGREEEQEEEQQLKQPDDTKQSRKIAKKRRREIDTALNLIGEQFMASCKLDPTEPVTGQPSDVKKDKRDRAKKRQGDCGKKAQGRKRNSGKKQKIRGHYCRIK